MAFKDAKTVSDEKAASTKKVSPRAFLSWEMVNNDGSPRLDSEGKPMLKSDSDIPLWGKTGFRPSKAEEKIIMAAKNMAEKGEELTFTMKATVRYWEAPEEATEEEVLNIFGIPVDAPEVEEEEVAA